MPHSTGAGVYAIALCAAALDCAAQNFPAKPIRIINTTSAGGPAELTARLIGQKFTDAWGQQIVVDTRTGAAGVIGAELVARAAPDGYTLLLGSGSSMVIAPLVQKSIPYDPRHDFAPVGIVVMAPFLLVAHPSVPAKTVPEFVAAAKARPGFYNFGSAGTGSTAHLGAEQLKHLAGIDIRHVPYKGALPAAADLAAGQVQILFNSMATALPHVNAGRINLLATGATTRSPLIPNTPTLAETYPGVEVVTWYGLIAPAKTPRAVVQKLNAEIARALASPELIARFAALGLDPHPCTPDALAAYLRDEREKWGRIVTLAGVRAD
jgi:tripartite-type tricarboxylate transporter receptor subunit TctC